MFAPVAARPSPNLAVLLGFLVPGGGHFYAGFNGAGVAWFVVVSLLTFAGWPLVGAGFFVQYHVTIAPLGRPIDIPTALPELANFLETIAASAWLGRAIPDTPLRPTAAFGFALTALGGVLNAIAMADAHWRCRRGSAPSGSAISPAVAAAAAFLLPGAGHAILGRRAKGLLAGGVLVLTATIGVLLTHGTILQRERDQFFWSGEVLLGIPAFLMGLLTAGRRVSSEIPLGELGLLFATVAGLLNVLLILDAYATAERDASGPAEAAAEVPTQPTPA